MQLRVFLLCFVIFSPALVHSTGYLTIQFLQYSSIGLTASGEPCDEHITNHGAPDPCDPQFRLTADKYTNGRGEKEFVYQQQSYYRNQDVVTFGHTFGLEVANPVVIGLNYNNNEGTIWIEIIVNDYNGYENKKLMSEFTAQLKTVGSEHRTKKLESGNSSITFNYHYSCNANYYGDLCNTFCDSSDSGHKWCSPTGEKVCLFGWVGASTDCKTPHPCRTCVCQHGGTCLPQGEGYTCKCPPDYSGSKCEICDPKVGKCNAPVTDQCSCDVVPAQHCASLVSPYTTGLLAAVGTFATLSALLAGLSTFALVRWRHNASSTC